MNTLIDQLEGLNPLLIDSGVDQLEGLTPYLIDGDYRAAD